MNIFFDEKPLLQKKVAWLESLFFLDSGSRLARGGLVAPKSKAREPILNINTSRSKDDDQLSQKSMRVSANNTKQSSRSKSSFIIPCSIDSSDVNARSTSLLESRHRSLWSLQTSITLTECA